MIELRPYQQEAIDATREAMKDHKAVVLCLPTGGGKTLTTAWMIARAAEKQKRSIFCVHRVELLEQTCKVFDKVGIRYGRIASGESYDKEPLVHVASIDTLRRRLDDVEQPDFLVIDEAHRAMAETWQRVANHWQDAHRLFITATPERLDGKGLKHIANSIVVGKDTRWLIENEFLSPYKVFAPSAPPTLSNIKVVSGDFSTRELDNLMNVRSITGNAVVHWRKHCENAQAIVFCVSVSHSLSVAQEFRSYGYHAEHIDGTTPKKDREEIIDRFRRGETKVLTNVDIATEGLDIPNIIAMIDLAPTKSLTKYRQRVGRALRRSEGKSFAVILDHAGNTMEHGLPCAPHAWSLEGRKDKNKNKVHVKTCVKCFFAWEPNGTTVCPSCGYEPPKKERRSVVVQDGELQEITADIPLSTALEKVKTRSQLQSIAKAKGYKAGWVWYTANKLGILR